MSILDALRRSVDSVPGGRPVVAVRIGKSDEVLRKELAGSPTHKMGASDAIAIARICVEAGTDHCYAYASAVAAECGGRFEAADPGDRSLGRGPVLRASDLMRETSDVTTAVIEAMGDGVVSDNELARIEREISAAEAVLQALRECVRRVNADGKPQFAGAAA